MNSEDWIILQCKGICDPLFLRTLIFFPNLKKTGTLGIADLIRNWIMTKQMLLCSHLSFESAIAVLSNTSCLSLCGTKLDFTLDCPIKIRNLLLKCGLLTALQLALRLYSLRTCLPCLEFGLQLHFLNLSVEDLIHLACDVDVLLMLC